MFSESGSADTSAIQVVMPSLRENLSMYLSHDVWNTDELRLFYRQPCHSLVSESYQPAALMGPNWTGCK